MSVFTVGVSAAGIVFFTALLIQAASGWTMLSASALSQFGRVIGVTLRADFVEPTLNRRRSSPPSLSAKILLSIWRYFTNVVALEKFSTASPWGMLNPTSTSFRFFTSKRLVLLL